MTAPMGAVAIMLWPQAWPISGKASYSESSAIVGPRGGGLYSPQQSADREVARLIKKLG